MSEDAEKWRKVNQFQVDICELFLKCLRVKQVIVYCNAKHI